MNNIEDLIFKSSCRQEGIKIPVSDVREFTKKGETTVIDYGSGPVTKN